MEVGKRRSEDAEKANLHGLTGYANFVKALNLPVPQVR